MLSMVACLLPEGQWSNKSSLSGRWSTELGLVVLIAWSYNKQSLALKFGLLLPGPCDWFLCSDYLPHTQRGCIKPGRIAFVS
jgi:hypothetical protein